MLMMKSSIMIVIMRLETCKNCALLVKEFDQMFPADYARIIKEIQAETLSNLVAKATYRGDRS